MKKLITLLFLISSLSGLSQEINLPKDALKSNEGEFLVLKNGTCIECSKIKFPGALADYNAKVKCTIIDGNKVEYDKREIDALLNLKKGDITYYRMTEAVDARYSLLPRIQEGSVEIYGEITSTMMSTPGVGGGGVYSNNTSYFLEKGNKFNTISGRGLLVNSKNQKETLLDFLGDYEAVKKEIESPDYKNKWDDVRRLIKQYNIDKFNEEKQLHPIRYDSISEQELVSIAFYAEKKIEPNSYILINDSIKVQISSIAPAPVNLPQFKIAKVCLVNGTSTYCDLIMPLPPFQNYFEIELEEGFISLNRKEERVAKRDIADNYLQYKGK